MSAPSSSIVQALERAWTRRGPLALALLPLALPLRLLAALRRLLYRAGVLRVERLPVPVVVVGNIYVGGTGKTPLTIWLVQALRAAGRRPGVVSRGYGAQDAAPRAVGPDATAAGVGDEPLLIAQRAACPVWVGRARAACARALLAAHPEVDVIVCDDGLQHYALGRDVEIALFDTRGVGNGWTLPAGPLREGPGRRRDFTVVNTGVAAGPPPPTCRAPEVALHAMALRGDVAVPLRGGPARPLRDFAGQRVLAAAGIGHPGRFFALLRDAGLAPQELALPDHYDFSADPFAGRQADAILITEKDAVKCRTIAGLADDPRLWVVPVAAHIDGPLARQILEKLRGPTLT